MKRLILVPLAMLLASCSSFRSNPDEPSPSERAAIREAQNVAPANYRADVIAYMRNYLNDPTGVRNASISQPQIKDLATGARYVACMRYDAKKSGGGYAGTKTALIVFISGKLDRVIQPQVTRAPRENAETADGAEVRESGQIREACKDAAYGPFPELQAMTR